MKTKLIMTAGALIVASSLAGVASSVEAGPQRPGEIAAGRVVDGNVDVYTVKSDGTGMTRLTDAPGFDACTAYSRDGSKLAFCSDRSGSFEIWTMRPDGSRQRQLTNTGGFFTFPDYSPNGARVAFCGSLDPAAPTGDVWSIRSDGTGMTPLTDDPADDCFPTYSPDGEQILFISDRTGSPQIWSMKPNGNRERQLTFDEVAKDQVPEWSPTGSSIAYASGGQIWLMNRNGGNQRPITSLEGFNFGPVFSPNGREIAFLHVTEVGRDLYIVGVDGTDLRRVGSDTGYFVPAWRARP